MQIDMHYYGTYALARAAGLRGDVAELIATSAQFVDDFPSNDLIALQGGERVDTVATAHTVGQFQNLDEEDQRRVWVPFHFLPGGEGATLQDRLICRKNSPLAQAMVAAHLGYAAQPFAPELVGIAAHVYADTFAHYGFSGISSALNRVDADSFKLNMGLDPDLRAYISRKAEQFFGSAFYKKLAEWGVVASSTGAEILSGALGHGAVATYPDRPYLKWSFAYEVSGEVSHRDNPATYLEGAEALHGFFCRFAALRPDLTSGAAQDFATISGHVSAILKVEADKSGRIKAWQKAAESGDLFGGTGEKIPDYKGEQWTTALEVLDGEPAPDLGKLPPYRFHQAAAIHRAYVLRVLLPGAGIYLA
jgi:hypothetical protein